MLENLNMQSKDLLSKNISDIASLFPNVLVETEEGKKIDFDILKQELSKDIIEGNRERYHLDFPGKKEAIVEANRKTTKTLRPIKDKSVDFDNTKNIYIEGDNLEALKILQESYLGKIKCIYIDPPYNTGNDFVYNDKFSRSTKEEMIADGRMDEDGNILISKDINNDSNGRYHSDWLKMMYPRLKLARNILSDDGIIFISIGDNEINSLIDICNEIFGEHNHIGNISRVMKSGSAQGEFFSPNVEYIIVYAKAIDNTPEFREPISDEIIKKLYNSVEETGERKGEKYRPFGLFQSSLDPLRGCNNQRYYIEAPDGTLLLPPGKEMPKIKKDGEKVVPKTHDDKVWRWSCERYIEEKKKGNIVFKKSNGILIDSEGKPTEWNVYTKIWLKDREKEGMVPVNLITKWENRQSKKELKEIDIQFDFAKPTDLIKYLINLIPLTDGDIVLDFFSGSATTAHSVFKLNSEDLIKRSFILIQLPEAIDEKDKLNNFKHTNICDIGEERIRRAGKKIKEENPLTTKDLDIGFRVYKIDDSNMKDIYYTPDKFEQKNILDMISNIKDDRTAEDLLTQVMLNLGLPLDLHIEEKEIGKNKVFFVEKNSLVACFDDKVDISILDEISKVSPLKICLRESSFNKDQDKINFFERLKKLSPDTESTII